MTSRFDHIRKHITKKRLVTRHDRIMTLANFISISRAFLAGPLVWVLENDRIFLGMAIVILIVLTDLLDGFVARKTDEITHFGKLIDPVADKVCMLVVLIYLLFEYGMPFVIFFMLLGIRDVLLVMTGLYLQFRTNVVFESIPSGKWFIGTSAVMLFFYLVKLPGIGIYFYWLSLVLFFISTRHYFLRYQTIFKELRNELR